MGRRHRGKIGLLTDRDAAINHTEVHIVCNGQQLQEQELRHEITDVGDYKKIYDRVRSKVVLPPGAVLSAEPFSIEVSNELTPLWVTCNVDGQHVFIPRHPRDKDGKIIPQARAKIGRPVWQGAKGVVIAGIESEVQNTKDGFKFGAHQMMLQEVPTAFDLAKENFPDLPNSKKAEIEEKIEQEVEEEFAAAAASGDDAETMYGGFIIVTVWGLEQFPRSYQVQDKMGAFCDTRELKQATKSIGGAGTVPGERFEKVSGASPNPALRTRAVKPILTKCIKYVLAENDDKPQIGWDAIEEIADQDITRDQKLMRKRSKKNQKGKSEGNNNAKNNTAVAPLSEDDVQEKKASGRGKGKGNSRNRRAQRSNREGVEN